MAKDDAIEMMGVVTEVLPNGRFTVETEEDLKVLAHLGGKMRKHRIRVVLGDQVTIEVSPYDRTRGRVTYRKR